ncbi:hypothetical protein DFH08DRAFT_976841 [Mycena albidolilacea]|uniref:Uncharacterized protein n=1 Tax=Mycena albidolilacea TaxID=1033008 RepID=A0AAD7E9A0_9AGAR|nr:hypothetical protein DFH08DRAFT_976841 [Mycena albidolilacea]
MSVSPNTTPAVTLPGPYAIYTSTSSPVPPTCGMISLRPNDAKPFRSTTFVSGAFADGMSGQQSTTGNRLRDASLAKIVDDIKPFTSSSSRFISFSELIGYQWDGDAEWNGNKNISHLFRNDLLLKIYTSLIRGPSGASPRIHSSTSPPPRRLTPSPPSLQHTPAASSSRQEQENCESTSHSGHSHSPWRLQRHGEGQRRR